MKLSLFGYNSYQNRLEFVKNYETKYDDKIEAEKLVLNDIEGLETRYAYTHYFIYKEINSPKVKWTTVGYLTRTIGTKTRNKNGISYTAPNQFFYDGEDYYFA